MFTLSPNDNPITDNAAELKDNNFGGNREYTKGKQVKDQDYTGRSCGSPNNKENPVDETTKDIDDMTNSEAREREFSRRAETACRKDHNKEHFHKTDPENLPLEDTRSFIPDDKKHGAILRTQYGEGQYEGEIS